MFSALKNLSFWILTSIALWWSLTFAIGTGPVIFYHVYGGGGNTWAPSAPYDSDFVVLRNISTSTVDVTNRQIQNVTGGATFPMANRSIILSGIIAPGAYYLVEVATNSVSWIPLSNHRVPNIIVSASLFDPPTSQWFAVNGNKFRLIDSLSNVVDFLGTNSSNQALVSSVVTNGWATAPTISNNARSLFRSNYSGSNNTDYVVQNASAIPWCVWWWFSGTNVCLLYINIYTVQFLDHDGSVIDVQWVNSGNNAIAPSSPTRTGYTFSGWNADFSSITWDMTITAEYTINSYTLTFDSNGWTAIAAITGDYGTWITAPTNPIKTGYTFSGWSPALPSTIPAGDQTYVAQWTVNQYTVTFEDYDSSVLGSGLVDYGSGATAPTNPSRTGYTFSGWNADFSSITWDMTITAEYTINSYTLTFDSNGWTAIAAITGDYGTWITAPTNPTKTGYTFSGWSPALPSTIPAGDQTYVAQWILVPVVTPPSAPAPWWYAGWWGWSNAIKDNCPDGDRSTSYYDGQCGDIPTTTGKDTTLDDTAPSSLCTQADYKLSSFESLRKLSDKRQFIVCRLYHNKQTIFDTVPEFDYDRVVTREEASRMITHFVQDILKKDKIRTSSDPLCQFTDIKFANPWLKNYITDACQYGIFNGTYDHQFLPKQELNQAHAIATVLRASYGYQDESWSVRFSPYIDMISTKNLTRKTFTRPSDLKVLERRGMTRGNLWELMYRVAIDLL